MIQQTMEFYTKCHRDHHDLMGEIVGGVRAIHAPTVPTTARLNVLYQIFQESNRRMMEYNVIMSQCLQFTHQVFQQYRVTPSSPYTYTPHPASHAGAHTSTRVPRPSPSHTHNNHNHTHHAHAQDTTTSDLYEFSFFIHPPSEPAAATVMPMSQAQFSQHTVTYRYENTNTAVTTGTAQHLPPSIAATGATADRPVCPITLEELQPGDEVTRVRVCGHVFRTAALRNWCRRNRVCPVCRRDIVSDAIPTPSNHPSLVRPVPVSDSMPVPVPEPVPDPVPEPDPEPVSDPSPPFPIGSSSYAQRTDYDEVGTNGGRTMIPSSILRRIVQEMTGDRPVIAQHSGATASTNAFDHDDNDDDTHYLGVD